MGQPLLRSLLYVPADNERRVAKAFGSGSDAVILDLEDAVAVSQKPAARALLADLLSAERPCPAYVRVNAMSTPFCLDDVEAAIAGGADGISLPKVESAAQLWAMDWLISSLEARAGRDPGSVDLLPVLESGTALYNAAEILRGVRRVRRAGLGIGDLVLDLNILPSPDELEVWPYRTMLVLASGAAGLEPPLDTVYVDIHNLDGLKDACESSRRAGFQGRRIIHPSHVGIVNEAYSPTAEEIARAERVLAGFEEAERAGVASLRVGQDFVDYAIAHKARRLLATRDALAATT